MSFRQAISRGTYGSRPTAGIPGRLYICTDGPLSFYDDGSAWRPLNIVGGMTTPPAAASFTQILAGGRSITTADSKGGLSLTMTNGTAANDYRILKVTAPVTAYSLIVHMQATIIDANYSGAGVCWRKASSGSTSFFGVVNFNGAPSMIWRNETTNNNGASPTFTFSSDPVAISALTGAGATATALIVAPAPQIGIWLKITDDLSATRTLSYAFNDAQTWTQFGSVARTTFIAPDEIGVWIANVNSGGSAANAAAFIDSWIAA